MKPESLARLAELAGCSASEFITQLLPVQASRVGRATFEGASTLWLPVQLPSEDVLHEMFLALLEPLKTEKSQDVIEIGRATCRERVCQYVKISVVAVSLKKTRKKQNNDNRK